MAAGASAVPVIADAWETHPIRKISLYFCLATLFLRLSVLPELIAYVAHVNTYLLYLTAPPAILSALLMGSVRRTFRSRAAYYWLAFFAWMVLATPLSTWVGGSAGRVITYVRADGMFLVLIGPLVISAQITTQPAYSQNVTIPNPFNCGGASNCTLLTLLTSILNGIILPIAAVASVMYVIFAGFKYVQARGNPKAIEDAHANLLWALIGIGCVLGAAGISAVLQTTVSSFLTK